MLTADQGLENTLDIIEVNGTYNSSDSWRTLYHYYFSFRTFLIYTIQFAAFGIFVLVFLQQSDVSFNQLGGVAIAAVLFNVGSSLVLVCWSVSNARNVANLPSKFVFSSDSIELVTDDFRCSINWDFIYKILEKQGCVLLITRSHDEYMIPTRWFEDKSHLARFRSLIRTKERSIEISLQSE